MTKAEFMHAKAKEIRGQREELGLSRAEVAQAIGVSETTITYWEQSRNLLNAYADMLLRFYFKRKWTEKAQREADEQQRAFTEPAQ